MKSTLKFDLSEQKNTIIKAKISRNSDDLRDRVAQEFVSQLGFLSNLAIVRIKDATEESTGAFIGNPEKFDNFEIESFPVNVSANHILDSLCDDQKAYLLEYLTEWDKNRPRVS